MAAPVVPRRLIAIALCTAACTLAACGSVQRSRSSIRPAVGSVRPVAVSMIRSATTSAQPVTAPRALGSPVTAAQAAAEIARARSRIEGVVQVARATYDNEVRGPKLAVELARIARDPILLGFLNRGDRAGAQAAAEAQLRGPIDHLAHVTRIGVVRGSRVLVNATVNADGVFVVAPGSRALTLHGHPLGTLLVSIQDVTGFVKLVHNLTGAEIVARGASGRVRTSLAPAANVRLPSSGRVTIAGRRYAVRSFREIAWGNEPLGGEPLTVWVLVRG
jgi:hypothetical protein